MDWFLYDSNLRHERDKEHFAKRNTGVKVRHMFKVNDKGIRTIPLASPWSLYY